MRKYSKLLLPALVVGAALFTPGVAEAKVSYNGTEYDTLKAAIEAAGDAQTATFTFTSDTDGSATIPAGANYTINGGGYVLNGQVKAAADVAGAETHLTIDNLTIDGGGKMMGIVSQNQKTEPTKLYLTVTNSTIRNTNGKGVKAIYITNAQQMLLDNVTLENIQSLDYGVDLNLVGVHDAEIEIKNSNFSGVTSFDSPIKVAQRCLPGDEQTDIPACDAGITTSVKKLTVTNNTFDGSFMAMVGGSMVKMGASSGGPASGQFVTEVTAGGAVPTIVEIANSGADEITLQPGELGTVVFSTDNTLASDDKDFALEAGATFKPSLYLMTDAGKVELATVLNPEKLSFTTSDDKVATVADDGTVTAVKAGTATITATYGDQTLKWTVTVKKSMDVTPPATDKPTDDTTDDGATDATEDEGDIENPQTYDGMIMFAIAGLVSALGLAGAGVGLGKESE